MLGVRWKNTYYQLEPEIILFLFLNDTQKTLIQLSEDILEHFCFCNMKSNEIAINGTDNFIVLFPSCM